MSSKQAMYVQVLLLATAQALFQTVSVLVMTVGALAGSTIAASTQLATAPVSTMFIGTALLIVPASLWMARVGRRTGFVVGAALGTLGGLTAALGVYAGSLVLLCLGTMLIGAYQSFAQFYRFAASEVASDAFRPRAISFVLGGGIVAALLGPLLGRLGGPLLSPEYLGSFLLGAMVSLIAVGLLFAVRVPQPVVSGDSASGRPILQIARQPAYIVAIFGALTGFGVMVLAMTATPLAMVHHHHGLDDAASVIQLHVLGMFLPSFFTGSLISRFGVLRIMFAGVGLLTGHVLLTLTGTGYVSFASALILLGLGWNFLFVGGTTLLTTTYTPVERGRAQGVNDLIIIAVGAGASLCSGLLLQAVGWQVMNLLLLPWLAIAALSILWLARHRRRLASIVTA